MTDSTTPSRPAMPSTYDHKRAEHQSLRIRMLSGLWLKDLKKALERHISADRVQNWGIPEASRNPFASLVGQVGGTLYREPPTVAGEAGSEPMLHQVTQTGLWQLQQRVSTDLIGLREVPVRADWSPRGGLLYRPLSPDQVVARALPEAPDRPVAMEEMQLRVNPETGKSEWVWEVLDITDLDHPAHLVVDADRKKDLTDLYLPEGDYRYRDGDGMPFLPVAMYHAERTGKLWNSWTGIECVLGSLTVGVLTTFFVHGVKDGSFATVILMGGRVTGVEVASPGKKSRRNVISVEPGAIIEAAPVEDYQGQPSVVQLKPGFDPLTSIQALQAFEAGLAEYAGVSPADLVRTGADPRSGVSLSISREGLRSAQARVEPMLRAGDLELLGITAKILNRSTGTSYPESGYAISYPSLPLSGGELQAQREDILAKINTGLMSKVDGFRRLHPGLTRDQAIQELQRIQRENALFPAMSMTA